jgi:hypothetical protein
MKRKLDMTDSLTPNQVLTIAIATITGGNNFTVVTSPSTPCTVLKKIIDTQYKAVLRGKGKPEDELQNVFISMVMVKSGSKSRLDINSSLPVGDSLENEASATIMIRKQPTPQLEELSSEITDSLKTPFTVTFVSEADGHVISSDIDNDTDMSQLITNIESRYKDFIKSSQNGAASDHLLDFSLSSFVVLGARGIRITKKFDGKAASVLYPGDTICFKFKRGHSYDVLTNMPAEFLRSAGIIIFKEEQDPSPHEVTYQQKSTQMVLGVSQQKSNKKVFEQSFQVNSKILVIDPSYPKPTLDTGRFRLSIEVIVEKVKKGLWNLLLTVKDDRIKQLFCYHSDTEEPTKVRFTDVGNVPVDSTYIGVFDYDAFEGGNYERDRPGMYTGSDGNTDAAFYPEGVVIRAGLGDGYYKTSAAFVDDETVAVRIQFD